VDPRESVIACNASPQVFAKVVSASTGSELLDHGSASSSRYTERHRTQHDAILASEAHQWRADPERAAPTWPGRVT
jgi:hypothetical protein